MRNILFTGCSIAAGAGLDDTCNNPGHYSNLLCNNLFDKNNHQITNIAVGGYSNERIFLDSASYLIRDHYDYAFVAWTSLFRYVFWAGLELYECKRSFTPSKHFHKSEEIIEHNGNNISWSSQELTKLSEKFLLLNHEHYYIRDIVTYVNILITIAESTGTKIYFINNLLPWDQDYFNHIPNTITPSMLTTFTNQLLCSDNRSDEDINKLYHLMHQHYNEQGGIRNSHWLNLYTSFYSMTVDFGYDNEHPGLKSNKLFADFLTEEFKKHN